MEDVQEDEGKEVNFDLPPKFDEYEPNEGEMLVLESTWDDPKEEEAEQRGDISHSKPTGQAKKCSWIINGESCAHSPANLHTFVYPHVYTPSHHHHTTPHKHITSIQPFSFPKVHCYSKPLILNLKLVSNGILKSPKVCKPNSNSRES